ncbi:MAG: methyltransferase domain-containing protein [Planctomycetes bacterium]|nr:methyltransferase domain-containing protein [Planctomycetota bacterium]
MAHGHTRMFIKQLITQPGNVGSLVPSSDRLAREMVKFANLKHKSVVVELGPGTGVFTRRIVEALKPEQRFFAIELNENFARALKVHLPDVQIYIGNAADLPKFCRQDGVDHVDCVISGLPWAIIPEPVQDAILDGMYSVMPKGAVFLTFAYLQGLIMPSGKRFRRVVKDRFAKVSSSKVIWQNLPPAIIYRGVK